MSGGRLARILVRAAARLVPARRRSGWREEWEAELEALDRARGAGAGAGLPTPLGFAVGAFPHAMWTRTEGWTMGSVWIDLKYAVRTLRRAPGFTAVACLTLALGIGVNATIFSLGNGLLLQRPDQIEAPDRLIQIARSYDSAPRWDNWSWPAAELIRSEADLLSGVAGYARSSFVVGRGDETEPLSGEYVSGRYFEVLGVRPALGRLLDASDEVAPGAHPVVVLSHGLWMRRFGGDAGVVGRTLSIGFEPYEIVGVAPAGFVGVESLGSPPELWVPAFQRPTPGGAPVFDAWGSSWFSLFGRLDEGVPFETAAASMDAISMRLREAWADNGDIRVAVAPGIGLAPEDRAATRGLMLLLGGIAVLVLLLTCANVASLFLSRAATRGTEVGVRQALGAGRGRLTRQWVTESLVLALLATALAVPLLHFLGRALPAFFPLPLAASVTPDATVYLFLAAVGLLAGLLFGGGPAWMVGRWDVARILQEGGTTGGRGRTRARDALVVVQLAISVGLVSGAALLGRSALNARTADPGFDPDGLTVAFVNLRASGRYEGEALVDFQTRFLEELRALPGVESAALAGQAPVLGGHSRSTVRRAELPEDTETRYEAEYTPITPGYFRTMGISVLRGRSFRAPAEEAERVAVVNEALARRFWPEEDPVGKTLAGWQDEWRVVGVVSDVQMRSLRAEANPGVYYPYHQAPDGYLVAHVRSSAPTTTLARDIRGAAAAVDAEIPVTGVTELRSGLARSLSEVRTLGRVIFAFAALALLLAVVGLYGLIAHGVAQRVREIGIRVALGAGRDALVRLVMGRALTLSAAGVVVGLALSLALGRALRGVLFGVGPVDAATLAASAALLLASVLLAAWIPARRASRVDAAVSLRE